MKISILTPTYNRVKLLPQLYKSILNNVKHYSDVEWLIMDDGSSDNTKKVISNWQKDNKVDIKYYYEENSGKMAALNALMIHVTGDIVIEIDSDDYFLDNVFNKIVKDYEKVINDNQIYGVVYLKKIIGQSDDNRFNVKNNRATLFDLYYKNDYKYDTALTFKAKIRKQYKHEVELGEKFITEAKMYHKMDKEQGELYFVNKEIMICEYQNSGYTNNISKIFKNNPKGYYKYFRELLSFNLSNVPFKKRLYMIKHYILFCTLLKKSYFDSIKNVNGSFNKLLVSLLYVPGNVLTKIKIK